MMNNNDFDTIINNENNDSKSGENVADLERRNISLQNQLLEERFLWVAFMFFIFDICMFGTMETWAAPVTITILEFIILLIYARKCGVKEVSQLLDKILNTKPLRSDN